MLGSACVVALLVIVWPGPGGFWIPKIGTYTEGYGAELAVDLAATAQRLSFQLSLIGWLLVSSAALASVLATVLGVTQVDAGASIRTVVVAYRGPLIGVVAVGLGATGWKVLDRVKDGSQMAAAALRAPDVATNDDKKAYGLCIQAKADWISRRGDTSRLNAPDNPGGESQRGANPPEEDGPPNTH